VKKISIQGIKGSFHEDAARKYFGDEVEIVECRTFRKVCELLDHDEVDCAVMAIENSIAGSLLENYALLRDFHLRIIGEIYLHIQMNLMVYPGTEPPKYPRNSFAPDSAETMCRVYRPPLRGYQATRKSDTAGAARELSEEKYDYVAAIGNERSADIYGLQIIEKGIETNKRNYTRFLVLAKKSIPNEESNKASLSFKCGHYYGALDQSIDYLCRTPH
jgi:Prephenate dehydratase